MPPGTDPQLPKHPALGCFTPSERAILHWLGKLNTNWAIGQIVGCTEGTVKKHLQNIYRKLGVENRIQAIFWYRELIPGIVGLEHKDQEPESALESCR